MSRTIDQILAEVSKQSDPQRQAVMREIADLPNQLAAGESSLNAQRQKANEDIMLGARRRGVAYWGAPIAEQQQYEATSYAPALANMRTSFNSRKGTLESALSEIGSRDRSLAEEIFARDRAFEEQQRQFNEQMAWDREKTRLASGGGAGGWGGMFGGVGDVSYETPSNNPSSATMTKRNGGGYNFTNQYGNAISAAQYAKAKGIPFRDLLGLMARGGDRSAQTLLGFVGNDFGYDPRKIGSNGALYNQFVWGVNSFQPPKAAPAPQKLNNRQMQVRFGR